jgi:hypothetical protein
MNGGNFGTKLLVAVVALIVIGMVGWWLIKTLFGLAFYLIVGALIVAGGIYLVGKARNALNGGPRRRRIGR